MANCNHGPLHAPIMGNTPVGICTKQHVEVAVIHSYHPILRAISTLLPSRYYIPILSFCHYLVLIIYPLSYHEHCCWRKLEVGGWESNSSTALEFFFGITGIMILPHGSLREEAGGWRVVLAVPWDSSPCFVCPCPSWASSSFVLCQQLRLVLSIIIVLLVLFLLSSSCLLLLVILLLSSFYCHFLIVILVMFLVVLSSLGLLVIMVMVCLAVCLTAATHHHQSSVLSSSSSCCLLLLFLLIVLCCCLFIIM